MVYIFLKVLLVATLVAVISAQFQSIGSYKKEYFLSTEQTYWKNAQEQCKQNGMDPLTIRSKDEERILFDLIQQNEMFHDDNYYHVGAPLVGNEWKWTSDSSLVLPTIKWVSGEPNNHLDNEKCLSIYKSKDKDSTGFNDIFCETKRRFLCQSSKDPITPQPVVEVTTEHAETVTKKISSQFKKIGSYKRGLSDEKAYFYSMERMNWSVAQDKCYQNGMEPLSFDSKEEENRFFDLIRQNENIPETDRGYYVGGLLEDGFWKWKSDSSYIYPRMRWALGQPNNYSGRKTCLKIYKSSYLKYTGFHSEYCDHPSSLLCQKAVNPKMPRSSEENVNEEMSTEFGKIESIYLEGTGFNDINCNAHEGFLCQKFINPKIPQSSKETTTREESEEATTKTQVVPVIEEIPTHLGVAYNYVQYDYSTEEDIEN